MDEVAGASGGADERAAEREAAEAVNEATEAVEAATEAVEAAGEAVQEARDEQTTEGGEDQWKELNRRLDGWEGQLSELSRMMERTMEGREQFPTQPEAPPTPPVLEIAPAEKGADDPPPKSRRQQLRERRKRR